MLDEDEDGAVHVGAASPLFEYMFTVPMHVDAWICQRVSGTEGHALITPPFRAQYSRISSFPCCHLTEKYQLSVD